MKADMILKSNAIFTGCDSKPFKGMVYIKENKIIKVHKSDEDVNIGDDTQMLDFGDKLIMPGFVDAHVHYFMGALAASEYMCTEIGASASEEECVAMVREYAKNHPKAKRITGIGWFPANWNDAPLPTKRSLDAAFPDIPVYLIAADVHTFWMNTKALEEAGITKDMRPASGSIGKFEDGELNGLLFEPDAFAPAMEKVMELDKDVMKKIHKDFLQHINEKGVTSISEMSADDYTASTHSKYSVIQEMEKDGDLTCRLHMYMQQGSLTDFTETLKYRKEFWTEKMRVSGVKGFVDGVTSTYTGLLLEPYTDRLDTCGIDVPNVPHDQLKASIIAANQAGLDVRLHCIADGSVRMALNIFEDSRSQSADKDIRNTIEHIENIHPDDIPRFAALDVAPSMQPYHLTLDVNEKITRIGKERCRWEWPHRSILDAGGKLAFGTDYPVVDFNPFPTIYVAVTRLDDDGKPTGINPEEKIELSEALTAYTAGAANAYHRDDIGVLAEGKLADIVVVDRNLFAVDPVEIQHATVEMTIMDGKIVYRK